MAALMPLLHGHRWLGAPLIPTFPHGEDWEGARGGFDRFLLGIGYESLSENGEPAAGCRPHPPAGSLRHRGSAGILPAGSRSFPAPCSRFLDFQTRSGHPRRLASGLVPMGSQIGFPAGPGRKSDRFWTGFSRTLFAPLVQASGFSVLEFPLSAFPGQSGGGSCRAAATLACAAGTGGARHLCASPGSVSAFRFPDFTFPASPFNFE